MNSWLDRQLSPDALLTQLPERLMECNLLETLEAHGSDEALRTYLLSTSTLSLENWSTEAQTDDVKETMKSRIRQWAGSVLTKIQALTKRGHELLQSLLSRFPKRIEAKENATSSHSEQDTMGWGESILIALGVVGVVFGLLKLRALSLKDVQSAESTVAKNIEKIKLITHSPALEAEGDTLKDKMHAWSNSAVTKLQGMIEKIKTKSSEVFPAGVHAFNAASVTASHWLESGKENFSKVAPILMRLLSKCAWVLYHIILKGMKLLLSVVRKLNDNPLPVE